MSERMNKEQAKNILKDFNKQIKDYGEDMMPEEKELSQALDIAIESLDNEWVDVRDRLPQPNGTDEYLVCDDDGLIYVASYETKEDGTCEWFGGKGLDDYDFYNINLIAWKPLPQPYERKE